MEYHNFYERAKTHLSFYSQGGPMDAYRIGGIEIKLFRAGALSILLRFRWNENIEQGAEIISIADCVNFIRYPEEILTEMEMTTKQCQVGSLNMMARYVCLEVFNDFLRELKNKELIKPISTQLNKQKNNKLFGEIIALIEKKKIVKQIIIH